MPRRLSAAARDARYATVVQLRRVRTPWAQIGAALTPPVTAARAFQIYEEALIHNPLTAAQIDVHRVEAMEIADLAVRRLMQIATDPKTGPRTQVEAWNAIRGWEERKSRLTGADAPIKHEVLTIDMIDAKIAALEAEMNIREQLAPRGDNDALLTEIQELEAELAGRAPAGQAEASSGTSG